jgi:hypothetical protein
MICNKVCNRCHGIAEDVERTERGNDVGESVGDDVGAFGSGSGFDEAVGRKTASAVKTKFPVKSRQEVYFGYILNLRNR